MKWSIGLFFIPCLALADTAYMHVPSQQVRWFRPESVTIGSATYASPGDGRLIEAGYALVEYAANVPFEDRVISWSPPAIRAMTQEELGKRAADIAAEQAEAEALARLPLQAPNGIAVQGSTGRWIELEPTGDGLPVIGTPVSHSPLAPDVHSQMKAAGKAAHEAKRAAAKGAKNDKEQLQLVVEGVFGK